MFAEDTDIRLQRRLRNGEESGMNLSPTCNLAGHDANSSQGTRYIDRHPQEEEETKFFDVSYPIRLSNAWY
jgi:hypothetical protein